MEIYAIKSEGKVMKKVILAIIISMFLVCSTLSCVSNAETSSAHSDANIEQGTITEDNTETSEIKTRFYFDGSQLVYIKTITKDSEELLKVNLTYKVQNQSFEIPSDYVEG